jgi:glucose/mannose-6-phosphate isomerase
MTADPSVLDDRRALSADGATTMLSLVRSTGRQLREGYRAGRTAGDLPSGGALRSVAICGMGGSGVVGDIVRSLYAGRLPLPIVAVKGYALPEFCGRDTLALAVSFSGDTEETLASYADAVSRGCRVVAVSTGGELAARAGEDQVPHVTLPRNVPVPRAALGFAAAVPIGVLEAMGLIPPAAAEVERTAGRLEELAPRLGPEVPVQENEAKKLTAWIGDRTPVIWGSEGIAEAAAVRWKTQMNENAKVPAFCSVLPELDHNEVEGWSNGTGEAFVGIALRHRGEHPRVGPRIVATLEAIRGSGLEVRELHGSGFGPLETLFSLIMLGDFVSTYLGILRGVDPLAVPVLTMLKERLRR